VTSRLVLLVRAFEARKAKVANFDVVFGVEKYILRFEVPVHELLPMQIHHSIADLLANVHALRQREAAAALVENIENVLALCQFLNEVAVGPLRAVAEQAYNVGMLQLAHNICFTAELLKREQEN
jgi:hypothetical protein